MRPKIRVELATDEFGGAIKALADANGFDPFEDGPVDWSRVHPWWLVAIHEDRVVAAVQICPSFPVGRIDLLFVWPDLPKRIRALAVRRIMETAAATLRAQGCQGAIGIVSDEMPEWQNLLESRWGAVELERGTMMQVRFADGREQK